MIQTFTPDDVLRSQSGELNQEENILLKATILEKEELNAFAESAETLENEMDDLIEEPSERPFKNIMAFLEKRKKDAKEEQL